MAEEAFCCVLLRPAAEFQVPSAVARLAGVELSRSLEFRYFNLPLVAVLLDAAGVPVWAPTMFLAALGLRSRSRTGDTVRTYAESLKLWLSFLKVNGVSPSEANEELLGSFRAELVHGDAAKGRPAKAPATANLRIAAACTFHLWAQQTGVQRSPLGLTLASPTLLIRRRDRRGMGRRRVSAALTPTVISRLPVILSEYELKALMRVAPMPYRLMFRWAVATGIRRFELAGLKIQDLPVQRQQDSLGDGIVRINLMRKGARETTLHVPRHLIEETAWYIHTERPDPANGHEAYVFLNRCGRRMDRRAVSRAFRKTASSIGSAATLHHLRHTYAVHLLRFLERINSSVEPINSLKTLQILLGHANVETTEIYLRGMEAASPEVVEALDYLYGATL